MKITFFRLKGYVKVLNGMGLDEIAIPFDTFKNRIILIQGENGCSKSTIIAALSPNPDTSDSFRTDVFIDGNGNQQIIEYPAEKEIHYVDIDQNGDVNYYQILIQSIVDESRTRRTTKAFISKNGEELNPNGNVSSFKEIRDSLLGIDPVYLDLSSISTENRGIVDMIPSERRKYMAAYIGSLDTYNNIFKTLSKKVNSLKSYLNTLNTKIYELGNESELRLQLLQSESTLQNLNTQRDEFIKKLAETEAVVKLIDPENKIQDSYQSISSRLEIIKTQIRQNHISAGLLYSELQIHPESVDLMTLHNEIIKNLTTFKEQLSSEKNQIALEINLNEALFTSLESDKNILQGLLSNNIPTNIEEAVLKLREEAKSYEDYLTDDDVQLFNLVSIGELIDLRSTLNNFKEEISIIEETYTKEIFSLSVATCLTDNTQSCQQKVHTIQKELHNIESLLDKTKDETISIQNDLQLAKDFNRTRPKECKINSCPYIAKYISLDIKSLESELENHDSTFCKLIVEKDQKERELDNWIKISEISQRLEVVFAILFAKRSVIERISFLQQILDKQYLIDKLSISYNFPEFEKVSSLIEKNYLYLDLQKIKQQLVGLEQDLKVYKNNQALIESLTNTIENNSKTFSDRTQKIEKLSKNCSFIEKVIDEYSSKLEIVSKLVELKSDEDKLLQEKESLKVEFDNIKTNIKTVKEKIDSVNSIKNELLRVEESIKPILESINRLKFTLANLTEYQEELASSSSRYDKMVFIRNACSPGNGLGIQSEYIKRYMNDIIIDCNKMLGYMFGGSIRLEVPVINEKQFSIPFYGPNGILVPDISNGSTAQKCMIGLVFSCVAMMKSSMKYNIPRFDEIDGGLDQQNRITFINVLNQILDFMHCEQCIICSHNTEFDTQNTTRLICSKSGILFSE